jgi:hypothetical protein
VKEKGFTLQGAREQLRKADQAEVATVLDIDEAARPPAGDPDEAGGAA